MTHRSDAPSQSLLLTPAEIKALWELGHYTPKGYLHLLLLAHQAPGRPWRIDSISQFCKDWGLARSTFYRAKAALVSEGLMAADVVGGLELTANSTNECIQSETDASGQGQAVSLQGQSQSQSDMADTSQQGEGEKADRSEQEASGTAQPDAGPEADGRPQNSFCPPILQSAKRFGVDVNDRQLRQAAERWPDRVAVAIACLQEKQLTVKHPTQFLQRAIEADWRPEKQVVRNDWRDWYDEAYQRGLVQASQRRDDTIMVLTIDEHWVPFEHLRRRSWAELEAQLKPITVEACESLETLTADQCRTLEAMAVLVQE